MSEPQEPEYHLVTVKRTWVSERLWILLCHFHLPLIYPFRWILTKKVIADD